MSFDWPLIAQQSAYLIAQHGQPCVLRRSTGDRWVDAFIRRFTAREMMGGIVDPMVRYALVAVPVDPIPDHQLDRLITYEQPLADVPVELEVLRILSQPERIEPAGQIAFWKLTVRR